MANLPDFKLFHAEPRKSKDGEEDSSYLQPIGAVWKGETKAGEEKLSLKFDCLPVDWDGRLIALPYRENADRQDEKKVVNA